MSLVPSSHPQYGRGSDLFRVGNFPEVLIESQKTPQGR